MLSTLRIKNLALVSDLTLLLEAGYNAITGETGAGKSIIIGALDLLLGERADRSLIRAGADSCSVEAVFELKGRNGAVERLLEENGLEPCVENQLLLKRVFTAAGSNRQFVNGSPATLHVLAAIGRELVDMHGPHEHQSLLHSARQLDILDAFASLKPLREKFAALVGQRRALEAQKAALIVDEQTYAQQLDLLRFQVNEISSAKLLPDEQEQVEQEFKRAGNAARLLELSQAALNLLGEQDDSVLRQAEELGRTLQSLQRLDPGAASLASAHEQAATMWGELQLALRRYAETVEVDPARLSELERRLDVIHSLRRKYGATLVDVIAFGADAEKKLRQLESRDVELARLNAELEKLGREITKVGGELSAQRRKAIPKLAKAAAQQLEGLGFQQSHFNVAISTAAAVTPSGMDEIEFQFAPNAGESTRPLRAIASSGEMSRVMLALKTVLAAEDEIPLLVFDEIDANVGGETAIVVGQKMSQIARRHQVICITHLPAVAASADSHFVVTKRQVDGRTISEITLLDRPGRVQELTRMLGGQSEAARRHAEDLLKSINPPSTRA
ncbi:MAG TPA: DNA repair protein RecN [Verrucomicrobiae bacterium]|jgi:DNA repair protein RecN (Recombination protein N)|nr:DNA repair protein RecN [Verrucomicrobiae bacterium]